MTPLKPIPARHRVALGIGFFALFVLAWAAVSFGGLVPKTFLADPLTMLREGWNLFARYGFAWDVGITIWRVLGGFVLAAVFAVPLGVAMGAYKPVEAFFEPFVSFARYLPASAFIPLLILWAGIGELQKLLVIFIGSFFQVVLMVAVAVGATRRDLVEAAYTLGASSGIGHMITDSQALLNTGQIIFGIIVIGVIGLISDFAFKWANQRLFPWSLA